MKKLDIGKIVKYSVWFGIGSAFLSSFLFALTSWWQLALLAGILGGIWTPKIGKAVLSGAIGVCFGWGLSVLLKILTQHTQLLLDQIAGLIFEAEGFGFLIIIGILVIGAILGALGGIVGHAIHLWIFIEDKKK